jgi:CheY-like chemotaxis protein
VHARRTAIRKTPRRHGTARRGLLLRCADLYIRVHTLPFTLDRKRAQMRPSPCAYSRPQHLAAALAETALGAVPLAGGQSLIPAMRQREAAPAALVDLNHIAELPAALEWTAHSLRIGARVTHAQLLADATVAARLPWLTQAVRALGDVHAVTTVGSAVDALRLLVNGAHFDAVLCDVVMPGMNGPELLGEIERRWPDLATRVTMMVGGSSRDAARQLGGDRALLSKPFDAATLREVVAQTLATR